MDTGLFNVIICLMSEVVDSPVGNLGQRDLFLFHVYSCLFLLCPISQDPGPVDTPANTALKSRVSLCVSGMGWAWGSAGSPSSLWGEEGKPVLAREASSQEQGEEEDNLRGVFLRQLSSSMSRDSWDSLGPSQRVREVNIIFKFTFSPNFENCCLGLLKEGLFQTQRHCKSCPRSSWR